MHAEIAQAVISPPHINSLAHGLTRAELEFQKTDAVTWTYEQATACFIPGVFISCGTVERKREPGRPRFVLNFSAPEKTLLDSDGVVVSSVNSAIDLHGSHRASWGANIVDETAMELDGTLPLRYRFPQEIKPTTVQVMYEGAILLATARFFGLPLLRAQDDYKSYFWQFKTRSQDWPKQQYFWVYPDGRRAYRASYVTNMGGSHASNHCQAGAHALDAQVMDVFDAQEAFQFAMAYDTTPKLQHWLAIRNPLSIATGRNQARMYQLCTFTDDPQMQAVGSERLVRLLQCFRQVVCHGAGFIMASTLKAEVGSMTTWIGHGHDSLYGMLIIMPHKALYAIDVIHRGLQGRLTVTEWTDMLQLLQHLKVIRLNEPDSMYLLWDVVRGLDRNSLIATRRFDTARISIDRWLHALTHTSAVSYLAAVPAAAYRPESVSKRVFHLYTDAAKEGTDHPAMAGFLAGYYWYQPLSAEDLRLFAIPVLELAAIVISCFVVACRFPNIAVEIYSDSDTSVVVLQHDSAHVAQMQFLHAMLLRSDAYRQLTSPEAGLSIAHISGDANVFADLPSRGYFTDLERICAALDITPQCIDLPTHALQVMIDLRAFAHEHQDRHATSLHVSQPFNLKGDGPVVRPARLAPSFATGSERRTKSPACSTPPSFVLRKRPRVCFPPALPQPVASMAPVPKKPRLFPPPPKCSSVPCRPLQQQLHGPAIAMPSPVYPSTRTVGRDLLRSRDHVPQPGNLEFHPPSGSIMSTLMDQLATAQHSAYADSTQRTDRYAWDSWRKFCTDVMGTDPHRTDLASNLGWDCPGHRREEMLVLLFVVWKNTTMKPRSDSAPVAKPSSAVAALSSVRRVHAPRTGIELVKTPKVTRIIHGFLWTYIQAYGLEALMQDCKEPLAVSQVIAMVTLPDGTVLPNITGAHRIVQWTTPFFTALRAAFTICWQTGFRKNEISLHDSERWHPARLARSNIRYSIKGQYYAFLPVHQLQLLGPGDYVVLVPPASKNDPFCQRFANKPIYLPFHNRPLCAARAICDLEIRFPIDGALRHSAPLIASDAQFQPLRHSQLDEIFRAFIQLIVPPDRVRQYSMHSFRIGLACALLLAGKPHPLIQAVLRWASPESLSRYARLQPIPYGQHLIDASRVKVSGRTSLNLPRLDNDDIMAQCQTLLQNTQAEAII